LLALLLAAALACAVTAAGEGLAGGVRTLTFSYRSHAGTQRTAYLVLPTWYGSGRHPAIPLVISPHGRGVNGAYNLRFWGNLPAQGKFALVSPDGQGRRLPLYSWGYRGQVDDLARMPELARKAFPWLRVDRHRIYAIGDSMGAQEALLLAARPGAGVAGVAAFDPVTDMGARYRQWFVTPGLQRLPAKARLEFGGTPAQRPRAYADRSPRSKLTAIAAGRVPIQLWWSHRDAIIANEPEDTGSFYRTLVAVAPRARVQEIVGYWEHAHAMHPETQLPAALACFGLLPPDGIRVPAYEQRGPEGPVEELPPERMQPQVAFTRAFCGRAGSG
jgi:poly(3-hydroxybutyrate) depolymerase